MTLYIPLQNVDNEHCAMIVEKGLQSVLQIQSSQVEINNQRVVIKTNLPEEALPNAVEKIRDLGYNVPTLTKNYPVTNLSCASCAGSTETTLQSQIGVVKASVNYANTTAQIEYIPGLTSSEQLKKAVQQAGY